MRRIHIFRAGRHTGTGGQVVELSEADVAASAKAYNAAKHEAPIVVGHPAQNAPAFGWVKGLEANAGDLFATPRQVDPAFSESVREGRYKKVSASFYRPDAPSNPSPGVWTLRHVGFLGAQPPAVKGLAPVEFADDGDEAVTVEFAEVNRLAEIYAVALRRLRDFLIEKFGVEETDRALPSWVVDDAQREAASDDGDMSFAEDTETPPADEPPAERSENNDDTMDPKELAAQQEALKTEREALDKEKADLAEAARKARRKEFEEFAEELICDDDQTCRLLPVHKPVLVEALVQLSEQKDATVEFGEGDDKTTKPIVEALQDMLRHQAGLVDFSERSADDDTAAAAKASDRAILDEATRKF